MEGSSFDRSTPKAQTIVLNVLSPSTDEVPRKLTFADVPISTTVRALKERIQNTVQARPALLRQRLIYQGKVLASEETSLKDIFGQEAITRSEPLSLHLVLSPPPKSHAPSTATSSTQNQVPQTASRQQSTPPQSDNTFGNGQTPQPNHEGMFPGALNVQQVPGQNIPDPNAQPPSFPSPQMPGQQGQHPMPPHLQNALNSQLAAMNQQFAAQLATYAQQHHLHQGPPHNHFQPHQWQQPIPPQPTFQQIIAQQQQARATAGQYGLSPDSPANQTTAAHNGQGPEVAQNPHPNPNPTNTTHENQGPHGESFRVVIQSTSIARPNSGMSQRPHSRSSNHTPQRSSTPTSAGLHAPPNSATWGTPTFGNPSHNPRLNFSSANPVALLQQRLSAIETSLAGGTAPPQAVFDHARAFLDSLASQPNTLPPGAEASLRTRLNNLTNQADHLRASLNSILSQVLAGQQSGPGVMHSNGVSLPTNSSQTGQPLAQDSPGSSPAAQATPSGSESASRTNERSNLQGSSEPAAASEIYLLSSPSGPHSLLVHHSGLYTTNLPLPLMTGIPTFQSPNFNPFAFSQANPPQHGSHNPPNVQALPNPPSHPTGGPLPTNLAQAQQNQHQHQQQQQQQQQVQNQPRDLARILLPLGGHLWLLIRLFGFVYFFTAGGGNRRAFLLGLCAFIVFIANTGAFRPLFRATWDPIRRHVEGLIPLAAAGGARDGNQQQQRGHQEQQPQGRIEDGAGPNRNGANANTNAAPNTNRPDPQALADRLLRDQATASLFRRAERAVALFVASLVPGVGERHIAARDAAEARRLAEQTEREARALEEREAQEERGKERTNEEQVQSERPQNGPGGEGVNGTSSGVDGELHGSGEGSGGGGEGMREREQRDRPLVEI